jgi:hypothetical protein
MKEHCKHCGVLRDPAECTADPYINKEPKEYCSVVRMRIPDLGQMTAIRRDYRIDQIAAKIEKDQGERDGLRGDLMEAGAIMIRAIELHPDALGDMAAFLSRSNMNYVNTKFIVDTEIKL